MLRSLLSFLLLVPALTALSGCGGELRPVAAVEVETTELDLPHRGFTTLDLSWRVKEPLSGQTGQLRVFVHLLDEPGSVVRTFDHPWPGSWRSGARMEYQVRLHQSALAPPMSPGTYDLTVGLYDEAGRRWPLDARGETVDRHEYRVAEVRVPADSGDEPAFQFSPEWLDSEPGRDRQILARRWLQAAGHVRAAGQIAAGELWLRLVLPSPGGGQELVLLDGASQQGAVVRSECGGVEVRLAGAGSHDVVLPIAPADDGADCVVDITPNSYLLELESARRRAVSLDVLAWRAMPPDLPRRSREGRPSRRSSSAR